MEDLYTTRQVQDILKVDRITIYRMLQDGRLKGVKIGQQWRFPQREVDRLLTGDSAEDDQALPASDAGFPAHCVQTIQTLFTDLSRVSAQVVDMQGKLLTNPTNLCALCKLMAESSTGARACQESWQSFAQQSVEGSKHFTCHAGMQYIAAPVSDNEGQIGLFLVGGFYWQPPDAREEAERLRRLAAIHNLPVDEVQQAGHATPVLPPEIHTQVEAWPFTAARAVQSILLERSGFIRRLQKIANLTQIP